MRLFVLIPWLASFLILTSFFGFDEENQLRKLLQTAEGHMRDEQFEMAAEAYTTLLSRIDVKSSGKVIVDWHTYADCAMRLADAYMALDKPLDAEKILTRTLTKRPPDELYYKIKLMRTRLVSHRDSAEKAYATMQKVTTAYPLKLWPKEDMLFFHALQLSLDTQYDDYLNKATRLYVTGFYEEAIEIYEKVLEAVVQGYYPKAALSHLIEKKVRYLLSECHFAIANYEKSLSYVDAQGDPEDSIDREMIYLAALCHKEKQEYELALEHFQAYSTSGSLEELKHHDHALFEIGYHHYQNKQWDKAHTCFQKLVDQGQGKPNLLAAIYLARMLLHTGELENMHELLDPLCQRVEGNDPLQYELYYLKAEAAYQQREYAIARKYFEKSLPPQGRGSWHLQALYKLGASAMHLGDDASAEKLFTRLLPTEEKEAAALGLARLKLKQEKPESVKELLHTHVHSFSLAGRHEALLLEAKSSSSMLEKERLYEAAIKEEYESLPSYAEGWYLRGLNAFQQGLESSPTYFEQATIAFEKAFYYFEHKDASRAAQILKLEAKANFLRNSPISSLTLLEKLLEQFIETQEAREETLYLRGLIAAQLTDLAYFPLAEESLKQVLTHYPKGRFADDALYVLATLYFQQEQFSLAEEMFLQLGKMYSSSPYAAEAWFWAAEAMEKQGRELAQLSTVRRHIYTHYPHTPYAQEAFFREFPYKAYWTGEKEALVHLADFEKLFPTSPLLVAVHYLIGMHTEKTEQRQKRFERAVSAFHQTMTEGVVPDQCYISWYYHAKIELAKELMKHESAACIPLLETVVSDFEEKEHPLTETLRWSSPYPTLFECGEYTLAKAYMQHKHCGKAAAVLSRMLARYKEAGIDSGLYLSHTWKQQGKLAMEQGEWKAAIDCFEIAESSGKQELSEYQKLALWILESTCYEKSNDCDQALRSLSKVINSSAQSPLKAKAMYLRAEIYERQSRPALAIRQLEATRKKGGSWGKRAAEKLWSDYGME